jgi:hypothetical protein
VCTKILDTLAHLDMLTPNGPDCVPSLDTFLFILFTSMVMPCSVHHSCMQSSKLCNAVMEVASTAVSSAYMRRDIYTRRIAAGPAVRATLL